MISDGQVYTQLYNVQHESPSFLLLARNPNPLTHSELTAVLFFSVLSVRD